MALQSDPALYRRAVDVNICKTHAYPDDYRLVAPKRRLGQLDERLAVAVLSRDR